MSTSFKSSIASIRLAPANTKAQAPPAPALPISPPSSLKDLKKTPSVASSEDAFTQGPLVSKDPREDYDGSYVFAPSACRS